MKAPSRVTLRLAERVLAAVRELRSARLRDILSRIDNVIEFSDRLRAARGRMDVCRRHGWPVAARSLEEQVDNLLHDLPVESKELQRLIADYQLKPVPTLREILEDLAQLNDEFGAYQYDPRSQVLSVTTERITLESVPLGRFRIEIELADLPYLRQRRAYRVVALDPNCPANNESVTHPHVSDEHLCEGEATRSIGTALEEGRFCEFFMLVRSVLSHYNADSPYVSLDRWDGVSCYDCGGTWDADDLRFCEGCEHDYCIDWRLRQVRELPRLTLLRLSPELPHVQPARLRGVPRPLRRMRHECLCRLPPTNPLSHLPQAAGGEPTP